MTRPSAAVEIRRAVGAIWDASPADLAGIASAHRPPSRGMVKRLYANFDLYWTAGFLHFASRELRGQRGGWAESRGLVAAIADGCARRLDLWNCTAATAVLRQAAVAVRNAETVDDGLAVLDATVLYLNTLLSWVDASIPWSALDDVPARDVRGLRP